MPQHTRTLYQPTQWITNNLIAHLVLKQLEKLSISLLFGHHLHFHATILSWGAGQGCYFTCSHARKKSEG